MDAAAQQARLESGLVVERNKAGFDRPFTTETLLHDPHSGIGDIPHPVEEQNQNHYRTQQPEYGKRA